MRAAVTLALGTIIGLSLSGTAMAASRTFELTGFDKIDISSGIDGVVKLGDSFSVVATSGNGQVLDNLKLDVSNGILSARVEQDFLDFIISGGIVGMLLSDGNAVSVEITLPVLSAIDASAGADVRAQGMTGDQVALRASSGAYIEVLDAKLGSLRLESSSGADIDVTGSANAVVAQVSSGADIDAEDLVANDVAATASSGGWISIKATASIKAQASSGGDIEVYGNPAKREVDASSGGEVQFE